MTAEKNRNINAIPVGFIGNNILLKLNKQIKALVIYGPVGVVWLA